MGGPPSLSQCSYTGGETRLGREMACDFGYAEFELPTG